MTTITIDDPRIESNYSPYEIQMKVLQFLHHELGEEQVELFQISIEDFPESVRQEYNKMESVNFEEL